MSAHIILHHNGFHTVMDGWMDGCVRVKKQTVYIHLDCQNILQTHLVLSTVLNLAKVLIL